MASSHTFVHSRNNNNRHVPQKINMTALHGATSAFGTTSPATGPQDVKTRTRNTGTAVFPDNNLRHNADAAVPSDTDSNPPEIGSVRDKIGRFAVTSSTPSLQSNDQDQDDAKSITSPVSGFDRKDLKLPVRSHTPQQVAARLATARNPMRDETTPFPTQHKASRPASPLNSDHGRMKGRDPDMHAPKPIRGTTGPSPALQKLIQDELREAPPLPQPPSIPRKPVTQSTTPTSFQSQSPNIAQIAALRSSPSPAPSLNSTVSRGRVPPPLPNKSRTFPIAPAASESSLVSSPRQLSLSSDEKEKRPALPPRPRPNAPSPTPRAPLKSFTYDSALPETIGGPKPQMTPSVASLPTLSHGNNSTSTLSRSINGMDEESLSNAIVASSLASARAPSPKPIKVPPTPPRRRRSRSRSLLSLGLSHSNGSDGRLPSPTKSGGLRQTLRDLPKSDVAQQHRDHHHHHHHSHPKFPIQRHPHKHHEGDRKRYRAYVTEPERKRYEGVWAANKGLHIPVPPPLPSKVHPSCPSASYYKAAAEKYPPNAPDMVLNLVVRDIWSRSQLPATALEHVWNLVDSSGDGLLRKGEFVVGMWLIDQQLKGHKLPATVPDTVWDSAGRLPVVKPPGPSA